MERQLKAGSGLRSRIRAGDEVEGKDEHADREEGTSFAQNNNQLSVDQDAALKLAAGD